MRIKSLDMMRFLCAAVESDGSGTTKEQAAEIMTPIVRSSYKVDCYLLSVAHL